MRGRKQPIALDREAYTVTETVRSILPIGETWLRERIARKEIRVVRLGKKILIPRSEIERLLSADSTRDAA